MTGFTSVTFRAAADFCGVLRLGWTKPRGELLTGFFLTGVGILGDYTITT
jgi:hypothetical protein